MTEVTLTPIVSALQGAISGSTIVTFIATGIQVALPIILTWYGARFVYHKFVKAVKGGRG